MKKHYTVGQLAALFHMDPQLLRHYDSIGLLKPNTRNEQNNWRVYDYSQVERLATIRYLRKLNFPLKKIEEYLGMADYGDSLQTLQSQSELLKEQSDRLLALDAVIQKKIAFIRRESQLFDPKASIKKTYPARKYILFGEEDMLYSHDIYFFHPPLILRRGGEKLFGAYLFEEDAAQEKTEEEFLDVQIFPGGRYLCGYHAGDYDTFDESVARLIGSAPGLHLDNEIIAINIVDQFVVSSPEKYQTEIQIRILEE